ncbi:MAG: hypothetical protein JO250_23945 [Armatimonadetes bacterium]|nr:hypothetical protein [Armatimonadota bacterium]
MKAPLFLGLLAALALPAAAQMTSAPSSRPLPVSHEALAAERARDEAAIQSQRDQIESLTRQMQALKAQLDALRQQLGDESADMDQVGARADQAARHPLLPRVRGGR